MNLFESILLVTIKNPEKQQALEDWILKGSEKLLMRLLKILLQTDDVLWGNNIDRPTFRG